MKIAPDIAAALGPDLLQNGLRLREGNVTDTVARIRGTDGIRPPVDAPLTTIRDIWLDERFRVRTYVPKNKRPSCVLVNVHGGGWVGGSIERDESRCCLLSERLDAVVASVGYRLAPEHPFPAAVEDCAVALGWAHANAKGFGVAEDNVFAIGASAGANLLVAAMLSMIGRQSAVALPRRQILLYPMCDARSGHASYAENAAGFFLSSDDVAWYWDRYADREARHDPRASILRAPDLVRLPPSLVLTAERDPLRDEGEMLAAHVQDAGVQVICIRMLGAIHGFVSLAPESKVTRLALDIIVHDIRAALV